MTVDLASLVSDNLDVWTTAVERKSGAGRGGGKRVSLYGIERLRPEREVRKLSDEVLARELATICSNENPSDATREAQKVTLAALRAPASADFVNSSTRTTHEGCIWTVSGEVDAQNGFGAKIRSPYRVKLQRTARDKWLPLEVRVQ